MSLSMWSFQGTLWIQRILQRFEYKADLEFNKGKINFNIYVEAVVESWMMHYSAGNDELGWIAFNTREIMELHKTFRISPFKPFTLIDNTQNSTKDQRRWRLHNLKSSQYLINFSTTWKITCIWLDSNVAWSWPKWLNKMILHWFALHFWLKIYINISRKLLFSLIISVDLNRKKPRRKRLIASGMTGTHPFPHKGWKTTHLRLK